MISCKICTGNFKDSKDSLVVCEHHDGVVHLGCCIDKCSWDKKPCQNAHGVYDKM